MALQLLSNVNSLNKTYYLTMDTIFKSGIKEIAAQFGLEPSPEDDKLFFLNTPDTTDKESTLQLMSEAEKHGFVYCGIYAKVGQPNSILFKYVGR